MYNQEQVSGGVVPEASRPYMPEGYGVPKTAEGLLDWGWARERLAGALNYWVGTTRPDGRPHAMPIWAVWVDGALYFEGSPETRRGRNLAANPSLVVHIEQGDDVVILEGTAREVGAPNDELAGKLVEAFEAKYGPKYDYHPTPDNWKDGGLYVVEPTVAFGWSIAGFPTTTTRWRFPSVTE